MPGETGWGSRVKGDGVLGLERESGLMGMGSWGREPLASRQAALWPVAHWRVSPGQARASVRRASAVTACVQSCYGAHTAQHTTGYSTRGTRTLR